MLNVQVKEMPAYDVIVVGGGVAGVAAAVAAARGGAKTLLMEKNRYTRRSCHTRTYQLV